MRGLAPGPTRPGPEAVARRGRYRGGVGEAGRAGGGEGRACEAGGAGVRSDSVMRTSVGRGGGARGCGLRRRPGRGGRSRRGLVAPPRAAAAGGAGGAGVGVPSLPGLCR